MVILQRSLDQSVQRTLRWLLLSLGSLVLLSVATLLFSTWHLTAQLQTVYDDRVVPLDDLQQIDRLLTLAIPAALAAGSVSGAPELQAPWRSVQRIWTKYLATYLTPEEAQMVRLVDAELPRLRERVLAASQLSVEEYRRWLAPLQRHLDDLRELQVVVAKQTLAEAQSSGRTVAVGGVALAVMAVGLLLVMVRMMDSHIVAPLGTIALELDALADGHTEAPPARRQLSGDFAEVGDQLRRLRSFLAERLRLLQAEQNSSAVLRATQAELVEAEKLASLGGLVAGVSHELNTPIGIAVAVASGLSERGQRFSAELAAGPLKRALLDSFVRDVEEASGLLQRNLARAAEMVRSFKQVAVDRTGMQRRRFELAGWVDELLASLRPVYGRNGAELSHALPAGIELEGYPGALGQVLSNLVANAVLHGLDGGAGRVSIELQGKVDTHLDLAIIDNGCGMTAAVQARIFEPFFTTRLGQGGSGLGLAIVRNLVMGLLGGRIAVNSEAGKGSRFVIHIPLIAPTPTPAPVETPKSHDAVQPGHV